MALRLAFVPPSAHSFESSFRDTLRGRVCSMELLVFKVQHFRREARSKPIKLKKLCAAFCSHCNTYMSSSSTNFLLMLLLFVRTMKPMECFCVSLTKWSARVGNAGRRTQTQSTRSGGHREAPLGSWNSRGGNSRR